MKLAPEITARLERSKRERERKSMRGRCPAYGSLELRLPLPQLSTLVQLLSAQVCVQISTEHELKKARVPAPEGAERSPQKAGVGGSIPSLATTIATTYEPNHS